MANRLVVPIYLDAPRIEVVTDFRCLLRLDGGKLESLVFPISMTRFVPNAFGIKIHIQRLPILPGSMSLPSNVIAPASRKDQILLL